MLLSCTDGIWANLRDTDIAAFFRDDNQELRAWLEALGRRAVQPPRRSATTRTAAVLRWHRRNTRLTTMKAQTQRPRARRAAARALHPPLHPTCRRLGAGGVRRHARALHGERRGRRARVPAQQGQGWVTAEYGMLPRATHTRSGAKPPRASKAAARRKSSGSSAARCARRRSEALGERTITLDCDVLQADGGTRTASITGGYVALADAVDALVRKGALARTAARPGGGGVGRHLSGVPVLDLDYAEDRTPRPT